MRYVIAWAVGVLMGAGGGIYVYKTYADKWVAAARAEAERLQAQLKARL